MEKITQLMYKDMELLDQVIRQDLNSKVALINQISEYIIAGGGKRIRPLLTLLCGRIAGFNQGNLLHKMAAMIEYIHTATLLHDDVVDESGLRRGRQTSNARFGNAASILVGDFIYTRAFQMMIESNSLRLLQIMSNSTNRISEGEVLQLLNIGRSNLSEEEYFQVIKAKTATLFEAAARVAAIVAKSSLIVEEHLAHYAIYLGTAFQIMDDILDYTGDTSDMGKNIGNDLAEGKVTLPLLYLLKNGTFQEQQLLTQAINQPMDTNIPLIVELITNSQAINYSISLAQQYATKAIAKLDFFPASKYKLAMIELAKFSVTRVK